MRQVDAERGRHLRDRNTLVERTQNHDRQSNLTARYGIAPGDAGECRARVTPLVTDALDLDDMRMQMQTRHDIPLAAKARVLTLLAGSALFFVTPLWTGAQWPANTAVFSVAVGGLFLVTALHPFTWRVPGQARNGQALPSFLKHG